MNAVTVLFYMMSFLFTEQKQIIKVQNHNMLDYIIKHMQDNNQIIYTNFDEYNIVYIEGMNTDLSLNKDRSNEWNDLRLVFTYIDGCPELIFRQACTTEPGRLATYSQDSIRRRGVARIAFGQYNAWKMGYHKVSTNRRNHPALIQCGPISIYRDLNRDGARTGDVIYTGIFGINQHGTRIGYTDRNPGKVENWSEGCLVGKDWKKHIEFINLLKTDIRYKENNDYIFTTTIIAGDQINTSDSLIFNQSL